MNCKQVSFLGLLWAYFVMLLTFIILYTNKELNENYYYNEANEQINIGFMIVTANITNIVSLLGFISFWTFKFSNNSIHTQAIVYPAVIVYAIAFMFSWISFVISYIDYNKLLITPLFIFVNIYIAISLIFVLPCLILILIQPFRCCFVACDNISTMICNRFTSCFTYMIRTISPEDMQQQDGNTDNKSTMTTYYDPEIIIQ
jgi:hypothetical protein